MAFLIALVFSICGFALPPDPEPLPIMSPEDLVGGGYVVFFRHAKRDECPADVLLPLDKAETCAPCSELNSAGLQDTAKIAAKIASLSIPTDLSFASQTCRTRQMADLVSSHHYEVRRELCYRAIYQEGEVSILPVRLKELVSTLPAPGTNTFMYSHAPTAQALGPPAPGLVAGDALIIQPLGQSQYTLVGIIPLRKWLE